MIDQKELRIGNWVKCDLGAPLKIRELHSEWYVSGSNWYYKTSNPIHLTPEILEKCHFFKDKNGNLIQQFPVRLELSFNDGNHAELDLIQDRKIVSFKHGHLKYLHQLQNFVYALTGEELRIENL